MKGLSFARERMWDDAGARGEGGELPSFSREFFRRAETVPDRA